jgi:gentisate 1,2-dioxygenase
MANSILGEQRIPFPRLSEVEHRATGADPAFLIRIHDSPMQEQLGYYEERDR